MRLAIRISGRAGVGEDFIPMFGEEVATAYRDGAIAYWRHYTPALRSEGAEANQTPASVIFGLSGLEIESNERPGWLESLSAAEAELATRYAINELNGFPAWFPALYASRRDVAANVLLGEIEFELDVGVADHDSHYVLSDISWSAEWAWNDLSPSLFSMLEKREPINKSHLHHLLKIIQGASISDAEVAWLAESKIKSGNHDHLADWFAVWGRCSQMWQCWRLFITCQSWRTTRIARTSRCSL